MASFRPGLVSVTFRELAPEQIIKLAAEAGLEGIEWGGDIHVPHDDVERAQDVGMKTRAAHLDVAAYGSYYRTGCKDSVPFGEVLRSALALKAPLIRVWAGNRGSSAADTAWWNEVITDARRIASMAADEGMQVGFEYHGKTLTDTPSSALRLMEEVAHPNARIYWQPLRSLSIEERKQGLAQILPWLCHVHVYNWDETDRLPLADGLRLWQEYLEVLDHLDDAEDRKRYALLEFVRADSPEQFRADSQALLELLH